MPNDRKRALEALDMYNNIEGMTPWVYELLRECLSQPATPEGPVDYRARNNAISTLRECIERREQCQQLDIDNANISGKTASYETIENEKETKKYMEALMYLEFNQLPVPEPEFNPDSYRLLPSDPTPEALRDMVYNFNRKWCCVGDPDFKTMNESHAAQIYSDLLFYSGLRKPLAAAPVQEEK